MREYEIYSGFMDKFLEIFRNIPLGEPHIFKQKELFQHYTYVIFFF